MVLTLKKILFFLLILGLLCVPVRAAGEVDDPPATSAGAMIVLHPASGTVLAEKNASAEMLIASTTKLMTALAAVENADLEVSVEIRPEWAAVEGSSMYLRPGERYTLRELLEGLLLASGNDAALAVAGAVAGDTDAFVELMNRECAALGLAHTHFANPHGLDDPEHYSCAADLAAIMSKALENDTLREIMGMRTCTVHGLTYENHNKLLNRCQGVNGGKTGYTMAAGRCLVTSCRRDGMELVCVTLSDPDDWKDHAALYDWAFGAYTSVAVGAGEPYAEIPVISGSQDTLEVTTSESVVLCLPRDTQVTLRCDVPAFAFAPLKSGVTAGRLTVYADGMPAARLPLIWADSAAMQVTSGQVIRDVINHFIGIYYI